MTFLDEMMGNGQDDKLKAMFVELMIADGTILLILIDKGIIDKDDTKYFEAMLAKATHHVDQVMAKATQEHIDNMDPKEKKALDFLGKLIDKDKGGAE